MRHGLCPTCGRVQPTWTPTEIVNAIHRWRNAHSKPPTSHQWRRASHRNPSAETVRKVFGSFNTAIEAAGYTPVRLTLRQRWTRDTVAEAIFQWRYDHGRLPRAHEWAKPPDGFPSTATVQRLFGSWNAGLEAAGYTPTMRRAA